MASAVASACSRRSAVMQAIELGFRTVLLTYALGNTSGHAHDAMALLLADRLLLPCVRGRTVSGARSCDPWLSSSSSCQTVGEPLSKVPWADLSQAPAKAHLLVGELESSFFGGKVASDPFDSRRLREGVNLMSRVCTRLGLGGRHSATTSRALGASLVLCIFENGEDRDRVAELAGASPSEDAGEWASRRAFTLCSAVHDRLVAVGGETDNRYSGRRRHERECDAAAQSLRWGDAKSASDTPIKFVAAWNAVGCTRGIAGNIPRGKQPGYRDAVGCALHAQLIGTRYGQEARIADEGSFLSAHGGAGHAPRQGRCRPAGDGQDG